MGCLQRQSHVKAPMTMKTLFAVIAFASSGAYAACTIDPVFIPWQGLKVCTTCCDGSACRTSCL